MSISSSDMYIGLVPGEIGTQVILALTLLIAVYFTTLKLLFGSFSIIRIFKDFKKKELVKNEYKGLFTTREGLLYHIARAQVNGDIDDAKTMLKDLQDVDKRIDSMEQKHDNYFIQ